MFDLIYAANLPFFAAHPDPVVIFPIIIITFICHLMSVVLSPFSKADEGSGKPKGHPSWHFRHAILVFQSPRLPSETDIRCH